MTTPTHPPPPPFFNTPQPRRAKRPYTHHPDARRNPETGRIEYPHPTEPGRFVSRQYLFILKARAAGRCVICNQPSATANFCLQHAIAIRERSRLALEKRSGRPVKPYSSITSRLEAIAAGKPPPPKKNVDKEARIAAGICSYCGVNPLSTGTLCRTCADRYNARTRRYHAALAAARAKLVTPHP
jgi:hypothetical protein